MRNQNQQLLIILLIVFIGFLGTSIAYPIFPPLFLYPGQSNLIDSHLSEAMRNISLGVALASYPLGQFIGSPILGGLSDSYGRKKILLVTISGGAFGYLLSAIALYCNSLILLLVSRFITGLMEGNLAIVRAMAADLTQINKYKSFGKINGIASIGYIIGPILGGILSDRTLSSCFSYPLPFLLASLFAVIALLFAWFKLADGPEFKTKRSISILRRFNIFKRLKYLLGDNKLLQSLLLCSSIFTFAVDIFYEFGPVYLTGLWSFTPSGIAIYNAGLCLALIIGSGYLPHYFSRFVPMQRIIVRTMICTGLLLALFAIYPQPILAFALFFLLGFSISLGTTNLTIQISNAAAMNQQGEILGVQLSLRMLGDACICLIGGLLIISSVIMPLVISSLIAFLAAFIYLKRSKAAHLVNDCQNTNPAPSV
jgi:MFS transporter, DHA1 family, tetracycline resistance protein